MYSPFHRTYFILSSLICLSLGSVPSASGGDYLNSAHGDTNIGVNRSGLEIGTGRGYARGNCAHCHEQHATDLTGGPYNYSLFYDNYKSLNPPPFDGICFKCHDGSTTQKESFSNYSYSYRAGNWTGGSTPDNIADFFNGTQVNSYHHLDDILDFITTDGTAAAWGYSSASNPCVACHNPHGAQGDPEGRPLQPKSETTRGWLLSLPSTYSNDPRPLWGDDAGERLNSYTTRYQAPLRFNSTTDYEPDGSTVTTDGSNLADFVTLCTSCHTSTPNTLNTSNSSLLGRPLFTIDWSIATGDKHGGLSSTGNLCGEPPYGSTIDRVLSCLDCHESHGSSNAYILRPEVNGSALAATLVPGSPGTGSTTTWSTLCNSCHLDDKEVAGSPCNSSDTWFIVHHGPTTVTPCGTDAPIQIGALSGGLCGNCHATGPGGPYPWDCSDSNANGGATTPIPCDQCHYHGATYTVPGPPGPAATHKTF